MAGLQGFVAGLDGTEGGETEEGACQPAPAAHIGLEGAFHATDRDIWRERKRLSKRSRKIRLRIWSEWNTSLILPIIFSKTA